MLKANNLCIYYDDTLAIQNLNFTLAPGEIFCLLGENRAGKTTTINIFLGLVKPTSGNALTDDVSAKKKAAQSSKLITRSKSILWSLNRIRKPNKYTLERTSTLLFFLHPKRCRCKP